MHCQGAAEKSGEAFCEGVQPGADGARGGRVDRTCVGGREALTEAYSASGDGDYAVANSTPFASA